MCHRGTISTVVLAYPLLKHAALRSQDNVSQGNDINCCFSELELGKSESVSWSSTKQIS